MNFDIDLPRETWQRFFSGLSRDIASSEVTIEVVSEEIGDQIETQWVPLNMLDYDPHDDVFTVAVGGMDRRFPVVLRHLVHRPQSIQLVSQSSVYPSAILVRDASGVRTLMRLRQMSALPARAESPRRAGT